MVSPVSVGSIDKTSGGLVSGQSFAINEDEGSANCGVWYLVSQLMMIVRLGEVKLSVTPSAAADDDDDDNADDADDADDDDDDDDLLKGGQGLS